MEKFTSSIRTVLINSTALLQESSSCVRTVGVKGRWSGQVFCLYDNVVHLLPLMPPIPSHCLCDPILTGLTLMRSQQGGRKYILYIVYWLHSFNNVGLSEK